MTYVAPFMSLTAFNCPHCGALAEQRWLYLGADYVDRQIDSDIRVPTRASEIPDDSEINYKVFGEKAEEARRYFKKVRAGAPFFERKEKYIAYEIPNAFISRCFHCDKPAIWISEKLVHPPQGSAPPAAADMPEAVKVVYDEANAVFATSPRAAAALLRLAVQLLCKELGEKGENINDDIGSLVTKGLDSRVQRALDILRIVGNNAVHPGTIDLNDNTEMALKLFSFLNLVVEKMITEEKTIADIFSTLPAGAIKQIEKRDAKVR